MVDCDLEKRSRSGPVVAEQLWSEFEPAAKELGLKAEKKIHTVIYNLKFLTC